MVSSNFIDVEVIIGEYAEIDIRRNGLHFRKITSNNEFLGMRVDIMPDEIDIKVNTSPTAQQKPVEMLKSSTC